MLACAFSVVRHADAVARHLGEPYGTLVLTISVIIIEVSLMAAIILHGENNPTLARDAMFATLMIVLNGMVGTALLMGALRYWEQEYNLEGARSFLVVIASLAVFALIMPDLTKTEPDPSLSPFQAGLFGAITILFYAIFLAIQTMRHRSFFAEPVNGKGEAVAYLVAGQTRPLGPLWYHVLMLPRRHSGALAGGTDRLPRGARQSIAAGGECVPRLGACHHRPHHPGGARHWAMDGLRGASWARPRRCRASRAYAVRERAHLRRRSHQRAARHRASSVVRRLYRADLQPLVPRGS
jgi:Ca2+/H+ antiporter